MRRLYLLPIEIVGRIRRPAYLTDLGAPERSTMYYGFLPTCLTYAEVTDAQHTALVAHADVYAWPANLDQSIPAQDNIKTFCEGVNIPTDWTTPATTYRQLLRCLAGIFQFEQRYKALTGGIDLLGGSVTLATRYRNMSAAQQAWFSQTVTSLGYPASIINQNATLRQMLKQAGDAWGAEPFTLGPMVF